MANHFDPHRLDVRRFAEEGGEIDSSEHLRSFGRLVAETPEDADLARNVRWRARGELINPRHHQPQVWVHLEADTTMPLTCQRCLTPVEVPLDVRRSFRHRHWIERCRPELGVTVFDLTRDARD